MSKRELSAEEIQAVGVVIGLVTKSPPKGEDWNRAGEPTLLRMLTSWFKDQL